mmetsp:Transcript_14284/g.23088  ORF Transcript_14284/g.23088 Transcript_14284/m.23088 type:complete len:111 (-) Transcript_14284:1132-1464(-)
MEDERHECSRHVFHIERPSFIISATQFSLQQRNSSIQDEALRSTFWHTDVIFVFGRQEVETSCRVSSKAGPSYKLATGQNKDRAEKYGSTLQSSRQNEKYHVRRKANEGH